MPAIWGCWSEIKFEPDQEKINGLKRSLVWETSEIKVISDDNFSVSFIYDATQGFDLKNHYFASSQNSISIFISGSIYNFQELLDDCNPSCPEIRVPEVIYNLYCQNNYKFINSLNGDFCIVIIDKKANSIIIIRDHIGIHPIAYYYQSKHLYFSTDNLSLAKVFQNQEPISCQYLLNQLDTAHKWDYNLLPNDKVKKLLPGHYLKIEKGKLITQKYWEPEKIKTYKESSWEKILDDFRALLLDAVKIRSNAQYKCAAHLSGGLDSGIVAALARKEYKDQKTFLGYSWSPSECKDLTDLSQEVNRIKLQGDFLNIEPIFQDLTLNEFITYISDWRFELYIFHELKVLEEAKKNNEKLIFSGWGGDEFISINNDGIDSDLIFKFQWKTFLKRYPIRYPRKLIGALYYNVLLPFIYHHPFRQGPELDFFSRYIHDKKCTPNSNKIDLRKWKSRRDVHIKLLYNYHIPARTETFFNMGIRHGINYRFPLLDKRIIEYILTVPSKFLYKGKFVRRILRELSDEFLPVELNWINQKQEPILNMEDNKLWKLSAEEIIKELPKYKKLPEFKIFNFDQLESDIVLYKNNKFTKDPDLLLVFIVILKKRYEFIKGYKNQNTYIQ